MLRCDCWPVEAPVTSLRPMIETIPTRQIILCRIFFQLLQVFEVGGTDISMDAIDPCCMDYSDRDANTFAPATYKMCSKMCSKNALEEWTHQAAMHRKIARLMYVKTSAPGGASRLKPETCPVKRDKISSNLWALRIPFSVILWIVRWIHCP